MYDHLFTELHYEEISQLSVIFKYGDTGKKMYFIIDGEVAILLPTGRDEKNVKYDKIPPIENLE